MQKIVTILNLKSSNFRKQIIFLILARKLLHTIFCHTYLKLKFKKIENSFGAKIQKIENDFCAKIQISLNFGAKIQIFSDVLKIQTQIA